MRGLVFIDYINHCRIAFFAFFSFSQVFKRPSLVACCLTLSQTPCVKLFQTEKEFADDNFQFDKNDRAFSKRVENTAGKGEIAPYEQFRLFQQ